MAGQSPPPTAYSLYNPIYNECFLFSSPKIIPIELCFHNLLRGRLTLRRFTERRNLWTFGDHGFHMIKRYSCQHSHFWSLEILSREFFAKIQNVPLPNERINIFFSLSSFRWITWAPIHLRRNKARPVIYYDFIIGWLLPSPPPGCHGFVTSFST